jgi:hypothetical protein
LQMLFHSTVNTVGSGLVFPLFPASDRVLLWYVYSGLWLTCAATLVFVCRRQFAFRERSPAALAGVPA